MTYTKGPWRWEWSGCAGNYYLSNPENKLVADRSFPLLDGETFPPDMRLIALAPELLDLAKMVVENYYGPDGGDEQSVAKEAKRILAKLEPTT